MTLLLLVIATAASSISIVTPGPTCMKISEDENCVIAFESSALADLYVADTYGAEAKDKTVADLAVYRKEHPLEFKSNGINCMVLIQDDVSYGQWRSSNFGLNVATSFTKLLPGVKKKPPPAKKKKKR